MRTGSAQAGAVAGPPEGAVLSRRTRHPPQDAQGPSPNCAAQRPWGRLRGSEGRSCRPGPTRRLPARPGICPLSSHGGPGPSLDWPHCTGLPLPPSLPVPAAPQAAPCVGPWRAEGVQRASGMSARSFGAPCTVGTGVGTRGGWGQGGRKGWRVEERGGCEPLTKRTIRRVENNQQLHRK